MFLYVQQYTYTYTYAHDIYFSIFCRKSQNTGMGRESGMSKKIREGTGILFELLRDTGWEWE